MNIPGFLKAGLAAGIALSIAVSCAPAARTVQETAKTGPIASTQRVDVSLEAGNRPWYVPRLRNLGFQVFDQPQDTGPLAFGKRDGGSFDLASLKGKVVLLNFWATWCGPCRSEMPSIETLWKSTRGTALAIVAVSVGEKPETVESFLKTTPYSYPIYLDREGSVSSGFVSKGIPSTYILDKQGKFIAGIVGSREYDTPEVLGLMKELAEKLP